LDPRPDTETLVEIALKIAKKEIEKKFHVKQKTAEILDLGTGSGCILIALLTELPYAHGVGVDLSYETLKIAALNAKTHGIGNRVSLICGSWAQALQARFDLIVGNPPYIASSSLPNLETEVRNHDPILALDGGKDGLEAYRNIFSSLPRLLKTNGKALFEIGFDQEDDIVRLGRESRIRIEGVHRDLAGRARVVEISCGDK
jgi:release factor glutamine methyltransferase